MKTYRVGLVGCGGIAQVHGAALQELPGVELTACADIRESPIFSESCLAISP